MPIAVIFVALRLQLIQCPGIATVGRGGARALIEKHVAAKLARLGALVELVGLAECLENVVEAVQKRDPVVQVASWERPSCRKCGEMLWKQRKGCRGSFRDEVPKPRRLLPKESASSYNGEGRGTVGTNLRLLVLGLHRLGDLPHTEVGCGQAARSDGTLPHRYTLRTAGSDSLVCAWSAR